LGVQNPVNCKTLYQTVYHPGTLTAIATNHDGTKTVNELRSAEGDCSIAIVPEEQPQIGKVLFVKIDLQGMNGEIESNADTRLTVSVQGGELLAFGSARPKTEEDFSCGIYTTYFGKSLAAIRVTDAVLSITVKGDGLKTETYRAEVQN